MDINHTNFENKFKFIDGVYVLDKDDDYADNFGKQWESYLFTQIDSINKFKISENFLKELCFNDLNIINKKEVLEIGSGAGRFTEIIINYANSCTTVDLSSAIFFNVAKKNKKLSRIKANFINLVPKKKFDIVICRGVLQHTPNPYDYIIKLFDFIDSNGVVLFDIYPMPKLGFLHPKYLIWRPLLRHTFSYEVMERILKKNISKLLKIKRKIKKIFFNSDFLSDAILPIWDYKDKIDIFDEKLEKWAILDTLDGIYAKYDKPKSNRKITNFLKKNNKKIIKNNKIKNYLMVTNY